MKKSILFALLLTASASFSSYAAPALPPEKAAENAIKDMDMMFVGQALERINKNKSDDVVNSMKATEELRQKAKKAFEGKDFTNAVSLAEDAKKSFIDTLAKTTPKKSAAETDEHEYKRGVEKINTFLTKLEQSPDSAAKLKEIKDMLAQAKGMSDQKKFAEARNLIDKAMFTTRTAVRTAVQGKTMTAEKDNSPKGVYEYELFRNETYRDLVKWLRETNTKAAITSDPEFIKNVQLAEKLNKDATDLGTKKQFEDASNKMLESTTAYKDAVRNSGIPIPD